MAMNDVINLNVGGRKMSTSRSTLLSDADSSLAKMFDPDSGLEPGKMVDGAYFIDADPDIFQALLNWLRYRKLILPTSHKNYEGLSVVAEMYGIMDLVEQIKKSSKVELDVGGVMKMCASMETISRMRNNPKLKKMLDEALPDGSFYIDVDPEIFQMILDFYRGTALMDLTDWNKRSFRVQWCNDGVDWGISKEQLSGMLAAKGYFMPNEIMNRMCDRVDRYLYKM